MAQPVLVLDARGVGRVAEGLAGAHARRCVGVLVGRRAGSHFYAAAAVPTPPAPDDDDDDDDDTTTKTEKAGGAHAATAPVRWCCPEVPPDDDWVIDHVRQARRCLPGGLATLGLFLYAPDEPGGASAAASLATHRFSLLLDALARDSSARCGVDPDDLADAADAAVVFLLLRGPPPAEAQRRQKQVQPRQAQRGRGALKKGRPAPTAGATAAAVPPRFASACVVARPGGAPRPLDVRLESFAGSLRPFSALVHLEALRLPRELLLGGGGGGGGGGRGLAARPRKARAVAEFVRALESRHVVAKGSAVIDGDGVAIGDVPPAAEPLIFLEDSVAAAAAAAAAGSASAGCSGRTLVVEGTVACCCYCLEHDTLADAATSLKRDAALSVVDRVDLFAQEILQGTVPAGRHVLPARVAFELADAPWFALCDYVFPPECEGHGDGIGDGDGAVEDAAARCALLLGVEGAPFASVDSASAWCVLWREHLPPPAGALSLAAADPTEGGAPRGPDAPSSRAAAVAPAASPPPGAEPASPRSPSAASLSASPRAASSLSAAPAGVVPLVVVAAAGLLLALLWAVLLR